MLYPDPPRPLDPLPDAIANMTDGEVAAELRRWRGGGADETWRPADWAEAHKEMVMRSMGRPQREADLHPLTRRQLAARDGGASLSDVLRQAAELEAGPGVKAWDTQKIAVARVGSMHFGEVLSGVANRIVLSTQPRLMTWALAITRPVELRDFRASQAGTVTLDVELDVPSAGDFQRFSHPKPHGEAETLELMAAFYRFRVTPQLIANDDVAALDAWFQAAAIGAMQNELWLLSNLLNSAVTLADGAALFSAAGGNVLEGQSKDVAALNGAVHLLKAQKRNGRATDADPAVLLVPAADEITVRKLVSEATGSNAWVEVFGSAYLDAGAWYLFADPRAWPVLARATLRGSNGQSLRFGVGTLAPGEIAGSQILEAAHTVDYGAVGRVGCVKIEVS